MENINPKIDFVINNSSIVQAKKRLRLRPINHSQRLCIHILPTMENFSGNTEQFLLDIENVPRTVSPGQPVQGSVVPTPGTEKIDYKTYDSLYPARYNIPAKLITENDTLHSGSYNETINGPRSTPVKCLDETKNPVSRDKKPKTQKLKPQNQSTTDQIETRRKLRLQPTDSTSRNRRYSGKNHKSEIITQKTRSNENRISRELKSGISTLGLLNKVDKLKAKNSSDNNRRKGKSKLKIPNVYSLRKLNSSISYKRTEESIKMRTQSNSHPREDESPRKKLAALRRAMSALEELEGFCNSTTNKLSRRIQQLKNSLLAEESEMRKDLRDDDENEGEGSNMESAPIHVIAFVLLNGQTNSTCEKIINFDGSFNVLMPVPNDEELVNVQVGVQSENGDTLIYDILNQVEEGDGVELSGDP